MDIKIEKQIKEAIKKADELTKILENIPDEKTLFQKELCIQHSSSEIISVKLSQILIDNE